MTQLALITGASGGIGQAVVMQLAQQDIHCVLVSRDAEKLHKLHSTLTKSHILEADVTDAQSTQQLWQQCVAAYGVPTLLVHCVGNTHIGALHKTVPQVLLKSTYDRFNAYFLLHRAGFTFRVATKRQSQTLHKLLPLNSRQFLLNRAALNSKQH